MSTGLDLHAVFSKVSSPPPSGDIRTTAADVSPSRRATLPGGGAPVALVAGGHDHLGIAADGGSQVGVGSADRQSLGLLGDYIRAHGDRTVHFSAEALELVQGLPVRRFLVVTDAALYRVAPSTLDSGIFLKTRTRLDHVTQVIVQDTEGAERDGEGAQVVLYGTVPGVPADGATTFSSPSKASSVLRGGSDPSEGPSGASYGPVTILGVLSFRSDTVQRKSFLLGLSVARPTVPILQKRSVVRSSEGGERAQTPIPQITTTLASTRGATPGTSPRPSTPRTPRFTKATLDRLTKPKTPSATTPKTSPKGGGGVDAASASRVQSPAASFSASYATRDDGAGHLLPYSPGMFRASMSMSDALPMQLPPAADSQPINQELAHDPEFHETRKALRDSLGATIAGTAAEAYSYVDSSKRPREEANDRAADRERIRAMINAREAQLLQNIEFKLKYPLKPPTRVPPGVEFDKAHEERRTLPDEFTDHDLLGPSLYPLWRQWKTLGGLLGHDGTPSASWTIYDTDDLIDSLMAREEYLYGHIGRNSLRRLVVMRELVEREKQMYLNKRRMVLTLADEHGADDDGGSGTEDLVRSRDPGRAMSEAARTRTPRTTAARTTMTRRTAATGRVFHGKYTKVVPFRLSSAPSSEHRLKMMDTSHLLGEMKANFEEHLKTMHAIKREQLERQVDRAGGSPLETSGQGGAVGEDERYYDDDGGY